MPGARIRVPIRQHGFMYNSSLESAAAQSSSAGSPAISDVDDPLFGFLDGGNYNNSSYEGSSPESGYRENHDEDEATTDPAEDEEEIRRFWENQHQLLQATLCRTSSLETGIRNLTKEAVKEIEMAGTICCCGGRVMVGGCRSCLMAEIAGRLRNAGYNSGICRTKWRSSPDIPSGEHTFLDVIDTTSSKIGEVRVIIELNFRAEFEMAKASDEYGRLVRRLPEIFVGKIERLASVIKILCTAAKKCLSEKKMHMGPWRKHRYMQAKWLGTCRDRKTPSSSGSDFAAAAGCMGRRKARSSMLTVDLLDMLPNMHCTAVGVM
ncbi:unnamed protein product [Linum tenue]|uniref:Uncharacterized protein n=1 Tax=Linum tenue TaxID=586396 RepID=A0AAV0JCI7_9ROSI|nr:unnamed protein product [Linum tenue]